MNDSCQQQLFYEQTNSKFFCCYRKYFSVNMHKCLQNPDYYLNKSSLFFFDKKFGDTTTVGLVNLDRNKVVIKRYNVKSWRYFLRRSWRKSKAVISWENTHYLIKNRIDTVLPIAVIEYRYIFLRGTTYFISELAEGVNGIDYFSIDATPTAQWQTVMHNIIVMMHKLYQAKIAHNDLQWGNILIVGEHPLLLDLDHMKVYKEHSKRYKRAWQRDVEHFKKFLAVNPSAYQLFCNEYAKYFANNSGPHDVGI